MATQLCKKATRSFRVSIARERITAQGLRARHCPRLGNYNEQLRVIDFPVYVSGKNDPNLTPLVPVN